ncbi:Hypothetical protein RRSL_03411 [Ralstonia solanacearum UW551]|nr:Hypothetical protein RRSL_03411 [Ralstonia solanacearum UW551]
MFDFYSPNISPFFSSLPFEPSVSSRACFGRGCFRLSPTVREVRAWPNSIERHICKTSSFSRAKAITTTSIEGWKLRARPAEMNTMRPATGSSAPQLKVNGVAVARKGDRCSCPREGHHDCVIIEGDEHFKVDGVPVAFEGHKTSCGAMLIATVVGFGTT